MNAIPGCIKLVTIKLCPIVLINSVDPNIFWITVLNRIENRSEIKKNASEVNLNKYMFFINEPIENIKQLRIISPREERIINIIRLTRGLLLKI